MTDIYDLIVIGGGASGLVAAVTASEYGDRVIVLEKENKIGRKILVSGNGRCNLMNISDPRYYGDYEFALSVFRYYGIQSLFEFWHRIGLFLSVENDGRVYPLTNHSASVVDALKCALELYDVPIELNVSISDILKDGSFYCVDTGQHVLRSRRIILSTGGVTQAGKPSAFSIHDYLRHAGHTITPLFPALTPIVTDTKSISGLSGIRTKCLIRILSQDKELHREQGECLFTDYGLSGICSMQCARFIPPVPCEAELDFFSPCGFNEKTLYFELIQRRKNRPDCSPDELFTGMLHPRLAYAVCKQAGIQLKGEKCSEISDYQLQHISYTGFHYLLSVTGTKGNEAAQVTAGGIRCSEVDPCTMESRLQPGLHITGELLNVDGTCGGYNLMFAFASGCLAGINGRNDRKELS